MPTPHETKLIRICDTLLAACGKIRAEAGPDVAKPLLVEPINQILDIRNSIQPPAKQASQTATQNH